MSRRWLAGVALAVTLPLLCGSAVVQAEGAFVSKAEAMSVEMSAQTRLRIYPRRRGGELLPGDTWYYPGRNAVRQCRSWLQRELRPSGPVVTPQMRCWWVPG